MAAPYPAETRSKGWRFELDLERIRASDTWALAGPAMRPWLLMLWVVAWEQRPAGSLPDNPALIAAHLGMHLEDFELHRSILLRGWTVADDGRLYHRVLVERVREMLAARDRERARKADYRSRKTREAPPDSGGVPALSHGTDTGLPGESATGTGTSLKEGSTDPSSTAEPSNLPACPHRELLVLYGELLPGLPQPRAELWAGQRAKDLAARWRWVLTARRADGSPYACDRTEALAWFRRFFETVADSGFLTGRTGAWRCDLGWLAREANFAKVVSGNYSDREAA